MERDPILISMYSTHQDISKSENRSLQDLYFQKNGAKCKI